MLTVVDERSRECLAIHVQRQIKSDDVLAVLADLFTRHGRPAHIRSGAEFTATAVREWLGRIGVKTLYIEPDHPGKMDTARALVASCATNCLTAKSSTQCAKPRS